MADGSQSLNEVGPFASTNDAQAFLARHLPIATAANPRYRSEVGGVETQWLITSFRFDRDAATNRVRVSLNEAVREYSGGALSAEGTHDAEFWLDDVRVSERLDSGDRTSAGDPAVGIVFNCKSAKGIQSVYMGAKSSKDWVDLYIQDDASRAAILEAFMALERFAGETSDRRAIRGGGQASESELTSDKNSERVIG
ncbi:MAG: hypothetical protein ACLPSW_30155 [Roseiarcus sp.]